MSVVGLNMFLVADILDDDFIARVWDDSRG